MRKIFRREQRPQWNALTSVTCSNWVTSQGISLENRFFMSSPTVAAHKSTWLMRNGVFTWTGMPPFKRWCPIGCWWCCWCWCWGWNDEPICCWSWLFIMCCIIGWENPLTFTLMLCSRPCNRGKCSSAGDGWRDPGVRLERTWKLQLLVTSARD